MRFPKQLCQNGLKTYPEDSIHHLNTMYARHKPDVEWELGAEYPDFLKIKHNQSFNWSAFSIPVWVRFDNQRKYLNEYGVMAYSVYTMRNAHIFDENVPANVFNICHKPEPNNYSHCELYPINNPTTKDKRAWRMALKHRCHKHLLPGQKITRAKIIIGYPKMWFHRFLLNNFIKKALKPFLCIYRPNFSHPFKNRPQT